MDERELKAARDAATAYAREHARELATELLEWSDTALLPDGRVRELAQMLQVLDAAHALTLARSFAERAALELAARCTAPETLTEWRKQFEAEFPMPPDCVWTGKGYAQTHHNAWRAQAYAHMWDGFVAARRTTPDREAIIEECAAICDEITKHHFPPQKISGFCASAIRAQKTAPTSDKGENS